MTPTRTPFAGLECLAPGDPLSSDGYKFQSLDRLIIDRLVRLGAVTHRHDAHAALANPTAAPTLATAATGGTIPSSTPIAVTYTLVDADGGESLPVTAAVITTAAAFGDPTSAPAGAVSYAAGTLLEGNYSYAATVTDGLGGETAISPVLVAVVDPGHANAEVTISGLTALTNSASGGTSGAGWRLWRSQGGSPWALIATGPAATDGFLDNGVAGDPSIPPPFSGTTHGANTLTVTVPSGQPAGTARVNIYASLDGSFRSPSLLGSYAETGAAITQTFTSLAVGIGAPPTVSTCFPGANQIDPDTDLLNWPWKLPAANFAALPATGNTTGDVRVTLDTHTLWEWSGSAWMTTEAPGGAAGGGLAGTYPNPSVAVPLLLDAASGPGLKVGTTGEAQHRFQANADGTLHWSDGTNPFSLQLALSAPSGLSLYPQGTGAVASELDAYGGDVRPGAGSAGGRTRLVTDASSAKVIAGHQNVTGASYDNQVRLESGAVQGVTMTGTGDTVDTSFVKAAAGVWQIPQAGGGIKLTSPDGTQTKQLQLDNTGALVLV